MIFIFSYFDVFKLLSIIWLQHVLGLCLIHYAVVCNCYFKFEYTDATCICDDYGPHEATFFCSRFSSLSLIFRPLIMFVFILFLYPVCVCLLLMFARCVSVGMWSSFVFSFYVQIYYSAHVIPLVRLILYFVILIYF